MFRCLGCSSSLTYHSATMLEPGLFDQGAESHVQRRLEQPRYLSQERLRLTQISKSLTVAGVVPDL